MTPHTFRKLQLTLISAAVQRLLSAMASRRMPAHTQNLFALTGGKVKSIKLPCVAALILFAAVPTALASSKWYVDGVHGNDNNNCRSRQHACKTISNALSLTLPGDSIFVAPAIYRETLFIYFTLEIVGSGAKTTIVIL